MSIFLNIAKGQMFSSEWGVLNAVIYELLKCALKTFVSFFTPTYPLSCRITLSCLWLGISLVSAWLMLWLGTSLHNVLLMFRESELGGREESKRQGNGIQYSLSERPKSIIFAGKDIRRYWQFVFSGTKLPGIIVSNRLDFPKPWTFWNLKNLFLSCP